MNAEGSLFHQTQTCITSESVLRPLIIFSMSVCVCVCYVCGFKYEGEKENEPVCDGVCV
jgi:hypothetical protein